MMETLNVSAPSVVLHGMPDNRSAYVYAIAVDGVVRYIGKGSGVPMKRANQHLRNARLLLRQRKASSAVYADHCIAKSFANGECVETRMLESGMSHDEAYAREVALIASYPPDQLWNLSDGGMGAGLVTEHTRKILSDAARARMLDPGLRRNLASKWESFTPEHRSKFIEASKAVHSRPGSRERLASNAKANWSDPDKAARMRDALDRGRRAPRSPERIQKRWANPELRAAHSARMRQLWADPVFRDKQVKKIREYTDSPEGQAAIANASRIRWSRVKGKAS